MKEGDRIEWHDARVERLELRPEGEVHVEFSRFYYFEARENGPATRIRTAELDLREVQKFELDGRLAYEGFVSYANVELPDGTRVEADTLGLGGNVRRMVIAFTNGAHLDVLCGAFFLRFTD